MSRETALGWLFLSIIAGLVMVFGFHYTGGWWFVGVPLGFFALMFIQQASENARINRNGTALSERATSDGFTMTEFLMVNEGNDLLFVDEDKGSLVCYFLIGGSETFHASEILDAQVIVDSEVVATTTGGHSGAFIGDVYLGGSSSRTDVQENILGSALVVSVDDIRNSMRMYTLPDPVAGEHWINVLEILKRRASEQPRQREVDSTMSDKEWLDEANQFLTDIESTQKSSNRPALEDDQSRANFAPEPTTMEERLEKLNELSENGTISQDEYMKRRHEILSEI